MVISQKMVTVSCLDCDNPIELNYSPMGGQIINCQHCNAELEVINAHPLELDFYYAGDWDDGEEWEPSDDEHAP